MKKISTSAIVIATVAAVAGTLSSTAPAHATVTQDHCSFTAVKPAFVNKINGQKYYKYTVTANCQPGRSVVFTSQAREQDSTSSTLLGSWNGVWKNWKSGEVRTWSHTLPLKHTDVDGTEELYHQVRFQVTSDTGVKGSLSKWDVSPIYAAQHLDFVGG